MLSFIYIGMARLGEVGALSREQPALRSLEQSVLATFAALLSGGGGERIAATVRSATQQL